MSIPTKDRILLEKVLDELAVIDLALNETDEVAFCADRVKQHAVIMALLNTGELAKNTEEETRHLAPEIPWKQIVGLRNVAAHGYSTLSMVDIWKTINDDVPVLKRSVFELLASS